MIGGGAAGMMAAGTAAEQGASVLLLEPNPRLGKKLRITGKGRCNLTNHCDERTFLTNVPRNPKFLYSALHAFPPQEAMAFFEGLGVPLKTERGGRVFPCSDNANDVADALADWLERLGVRLIRNRALALRIQEGRLTGVTTDRGTIPCAAAILCTGGISYPGTGSTGDGYALAQAAGHTVVPPRGSLVPLESLDSFCAELAGFAPRNVTVSLWENEQCIFKEFGEMLFAHFGVTGPLVLSASAHIQRLGQGPYLIRIDFKPALDAEKLDGRILRDFEKFRNRDIGNALGELSPKSLIPVLLRLANIPSDTKVHSVTREQRLRLAALLKAFPVRISGPRPAAEAIVTSGGVRVQELNPRTMASRLVPGLYAAGEVLDVDAYTGGFNLHIAWATGRSAGLAAGKEVQS